MEVKAIALDIDGTLTDDSKRITPRTKEALLEAERKGVGLILASGRPAHGLRRIARELELESHGGMLLAYNGAQVRDAATGELLFDQPMSEGDARAVLAHMRNFDVIPMLVDGDRLYVEDAYRCEILHKGVAKNIIKYERDMCDLRVHEVRDIVGWCRLPQDKVLVAGTDTYLAEHHAEMAAPFSDHLCCTFTADFYFPVHGAGDRQGQRAQKGAAPARDQYLRGRRLRRRPERREHARRGGDGRRHGQRGQGGAGRGGHDHGHEQRGRHRPRPREAPSLASKPFTDEYQPFVT